MLLADKVMLRKRFIIETVLDTLKSEMGVRRGKAVLSSGCKPHPAIRSSRKQSEQSWR